MANSEEIIYVNMNIDGVKTPVEDMEKELLVLRLAFGKLKASVKRATAPLGVVFIPVVQKAVWGLTRLSNSVGRVITALLWQGDAAQSTAKKQNALAKANDKVRRSVADFDELDRLETEDGPEVDMGLTGPLSPKLQEMVDKILSLVAPLREINFEPAVAAFYRLQEAITPISKELFVGLEWAWYHLFVPLATWSAEHLLPAFLDALTASLQVLHTAIVTLKPLANWLWEQFLQPLGQWAGDQILQTLAWLKERLEGISQWIRENPKIVEQIAMAAGAIALANGILASFVAIGGTAIAIALAFGAGVGLLLNPITMVIMGVKLLISAIILLIANWDKVKIAAKNAWDGIRSVWGDISAWFQRNFVTPVKNNINSVIGFLNGLISGVTGAINAIVGALNTLKFTVPDWVPIIGGKGLEFRLEQLRTPKIPYLAKGAVLPANKPFMAVLGDQKHGTNIEAPLDTIKQALAEVLAMQEGGGETVVNVNFSGDLAQLARVLKPVIDTENRRKGNSLATGGVL